MRITLKQLNEGFGSLQKLAQQQFPKDQHKLTYKISRIWKSAQSEVESMQAALRDLMKKCEITPEDIRLGRDCCFDYWEAERKFLRETEIDIWADPFNFTELQQHVDLTPMELALLDWLIVWSQQGEPEKTLTAQA